MINLIILILSIISGILYRLGGWGTPYNTKYRDWGCSLCILLALIIWTHKIGQLWAFAGVFLLSWGALSTYWKKSVTCKWWNYFFHGAGVGLAVLPFAWCGISWGWILFRAIILGLTMMIVSESSDNVWVEECGRGALIIFTIPILFL